MSEQKTSSPGTLGRFAKLFLVIVVVLLVPITMDQADFGRENVQLAGRIAAGVALLLLLYGIFSKLFRVFAFFVLALIAAVVLVSEGKVQAPRLTEWLGAKTAGK